MVDCPNCNYTLRDRKQPFCSRCQFFFSECPDCGEEWQLAFSFPCFVCQVWKDDYLSSQGVPLYAPSPFACNNKSYEMRKINPSGRGSDKYYWFICTPNFPSEQYKVNDPHCHARKNDWSGEVRISLDPFTHEPTKLKVKFGKVSGTDQTEIKKLVSNNKELIYEEWEDEWIRQN